MLIVYVAGRSLQRQHFRLKACFRELCTGRLGLRLCGVRPNAHANHGAIGYINLFGVGRKLERFRALVHLFGDRGIAHGNDLNHQLTGLAFSFGAEFGRRSFCVFVRRFRYCQYRLWRLNFWRHRRNNGGFRSLGHSRHDD